MRRPWQAALLSLLALSCVGGRAAHADVDGKALLERNCGRCHAVEADGASPLKAAPNLWTTLRSYPQDRLEFELAEGIGSRHPAMPQIQFTSEEIAGIAAYLFSE